MVAGNPVFLVGTKADLLPARTDVSEVGHWMADVLGSRLNVIEAHLVSARTGEGMGTAVKAIVGPAGSEQRDLNSGMLNSGMLNSGMLSSGMLSSGMLSSGI